MKHSVLIACFVMLFNSYSCRNYNAEKYYGKYESNKDIIIELKKKSRVTLIKFDRQHSSEDHLIYNVINEGCFKIINDSLVVCKCRNLQFNLKILKRDIIINNNLPYLAPSDTLYQTERYINDKLFSFGRWINGKKDGEWNYFYKYFVVSIIYKDGYIKHYQIIRRNN